MPKPSPPPLSDVTREFGRRVRQRREELGLTQEAAAERMDLHWTYLGQIERGRRNVSLHNIVRIAEGLEVDAGGADCDLVVQKRQPSGTASELISMPSNDC